MARNLMEEMKELKDRCEQLEQLCCDMYFVMEEHGLKQEKIFTFDMQNLGLLKED